MKAKFLLAGMVVLLNSCTTIYVIYPPREKDKIQFTPDSSRIIQGSHRANDMYFFPLSDHLKKYQNVKANETGSKEG